MVNKPRTEKTFQLFNPYIISSVILILLLYAVQIPVRSKYKNIPFSDLSSTFTITGKIYSNPVKTGNGKYYSCDFLCSSMKNLDSGIETFSERKIPVLLKTELVEAHYPGKLYSSNKSSEIPVFDFYKSVKIQGRFINEKLFISNCAEKSDEKEKLLDILFNFRAKNRINLKRLMYAWGSAGGLLMALLTGMREYTDSNISDMFRQAGLSHILALSGMHLNLFSGSIKKLTFFKINEHIIELFQIITIIIFVWFAGISPSLFRAAVFSIISITVKLFNLRKINLLKILSVTFLIHIIIKPSDAYELSFMLSYGALAGILIFSQISRFLSIKKMPSVLSESFSASVGAQGITAPLCIKQTGLFSPLGIISTLVVSPMVTIFIYSGLFLIILCLIFPVLVPYSAFLMKILYTSIVRITAVFSAVPQIHF